MKHRLVSRVDPIVRVIFRGNNKSTVYWSWICTYEQKNTHTAQVTRVVVADGERDEYGSYFTVRLAFGLTWEKLDFDKLNN